jgi:hypothetical protein
MSIKCVLISLGVSWAITIALALALWSVTQYAYYDDITHTRKSTCDVSNCTVTPDTCYYQQCSGVKITTCILVPYTCYDLRLYLSIEIGKNTYADWDSSQHDKYPRTCDQNTVTCYYDDRHIQKSLTIDKDSTYYSSRAGVITLGVFAGISGVISIVGTILAIVYLLDKRGRLRCPPCSC